MGLRGRTVKVPVGVCWGIAAYKSVELVSPAAGCRYDPHVGCAKRRRRLCGPPRTFAAISGHKGITSLWRWDAGACWVGGCCYGRRDEYRRTTLRGADDEADDRRSRDGGGAAKFGTVAEDFLSTHVLAPTGAVWMVAPAMNVNSGQHPATRANVEDAAWQRR